jgi:quinoprotein dehydrogenase-associated probable ABC transporter substrate-binding protein
MTNFGLSRVLLAGARRYAMAATWLAVACAPSASTLAAGLQLETTDKAALRVCDDPSNLPFSNKAGEGYENKIADLFGAALKIPVRYTWYPESTGFIRNTLAAYRCDVVMGTVSGNDLVVNTDPYYRSVYALVYRADSGLKIETLNDPALHKLTIGIIANSPPAQVMAGEGLMDRIHGYSLVVDTRFSSVGQEMIGDLVNKTIDIGVLWGPIAGYYAAQEKTPLVVVPLVKEPPESRMDFWITMGVRVGDLIWKRQLNELIRTHQDAITAILRSYHVPLLDREGHLIP